MVKIFENYDLKCHNTFGIAAKAKFFASIGNYADFLSLLDNKKYTENKKLILGGGSNLIFSKAIFDGMVIFNQIKGIEIIEVTEEKVILSVGGGENWHNLVLFSLDKNWRGLENLSLIPGSVGASPIQNIGAYGVELKDIFHSLEAWDLSTGKKRVFDKKACNFGYRNSIFKQSLKGQYFIAKVNFVLNQTKPLNVAYGAIKTELAALQKTTITAKDISNVIIKIRNSKLPNPKEIGNVGSFFKNPVIQLDNYLRLKKAFPNIKVYELDNQNYKIPAAWLIENCGFKGLKTGNVGVSPNHALILINLGKAEGKEVVELSNSIIKTVQNKFGITLEAEANII